MGFIPLIVLGVIILAILIIFLVIYAKGKRFLRDAFGTSNIAQISREQEMELENTPKSVSSMTRIYLPQLQKDFPELNWTEFKNMAESNLRKCLSDKTDIKIHTTAIKDYINNPGNCTVVLQTALEYRENGRKKQTRYNTTMMYVQDIEKMDNETTYSVNCPNCGAPVKNLGSKKCEYCGTEVIPVNIKVWRLKDIQEC